MKKTLENTPLVFDHDYFIRVPEKPKRKPIWKSFVENQFLVLVSAVFGLLVIGWFAYGFFMQVGVDQGYQPIQPPPMPDPEWWGSVK